MPSRQVTIQGVLTWDEPAGGVPTPPIFYPPGIWGPTDPRPDQGLPGGPPGHVSPPIFYPPGIWGPGSGLPTPPIHIPGYPPGFYPGTPPPRPGPPLYPGHGLPQPPGHVSPPIYYPPGIWGPTDPRPDQGLPGGGYPPGFYPGTPPDRPHPGEPPQIWGPTDPRPGWGLPEAPGGGGGALKPPPGYSWAWSPHYGWVLVPARPDATPPDEGTIGPKPPEPDEPEPK